MSNQTMTLGEALVATSTGIYKTCSACGTSYTRPQFSALRFDGLQGTGEKGRCFELRACGGLGCRNTLCGDEMDEPMMRPWVDSLRVIKKTGGLDFSKSLEENFPRPAPTTLAETKAQLDAAWELIDTHMAGLDDKNEFERAVFKAWQLVKTDRAS